MSAAPASRGLGALIKRGWNEIPEILGSTFMAVIGVGLGVTGLVIADSKKPDGRKHKFEYIVVRPDDPRAPRNNTK